MQELDFSEYHRLNAAIGWLELGNPREAEAEFLALEPRHREHPDALEVQWRICASRKDWPQALEVAHKLQLSAPDNPAGWIDRSYTLHELKRTREAWDLLLPAAQQFPKIGIIPYNLACYACQLGDLESARKCLEAAIQCKGKDEVKKLALSDTDLLPLRDFVEAL